MFLLAGNCMHMGSSEEVLMADVDEYALSIVIDSLYRLQYELLFNNCENIENPLKCHL